MFKKLATIIISIFLVTSLVVSNVNAGSDGELTLNQKKKMKLKKPKIVLKS